MAMLSVFARKMRLKPRVLRTEISGSLKVTVLSKAVGSSSNLLDDGIYEVSYSSGQFGVFTLNGDQKELGQQNRRRRN